MAQLVKNPPAMRETWVRSLGWEDPLEKKMATRYSILAWRIPWTIQSMESQRVSTTERFSLSLSNFGRKGLWVFIFGQWKAIEGVLIREKNDLRCTYKNVSSLNTRTLFLAPRSVPDT